MAAVRGGEGEEAFIWVPEALAVDLVEAAASVVVVSAEAEAAHPEEAVQAEGSKGVRIYGFQLAFL